MDDLVRWLSEQLDEDERIAREAGERSLKWKLATPLDDAELGDAHWLSRPELKHAERHDPARVLREIEARRRTIDQHKGAQERMDRAMRDGDSEAYQRASTMEVAFRAVLRIDAAVYRDRPGFRDEWRP